MVEAERGGEGLRMRRAASCPGGPEEGDRSALLSPQGGPGDGEGWEAAGGRREQKDTGQEGGQWPWDEPHGRGRPVLSGEGLGSH